MAKKKTKLSELTKELMEDNNITDVADLQSVLKEMLCTLWAFAPWVRF